MNNLLLLKIHYMNFLEFCFSFKPISGMFGKEIVVFWSLDTDMGICLVLSLCVHPKHFQSYLS